LATLAGLDSLEHLKICYALSIKDNSELRSLTGNDAIGLNAAGCNSIEEVRNSCRLATLDLTGYRKGFYIAVMTMSKCNKIFKLVLQ